MANKDYYKVLGVGHKATPEEIKRAYRKLARQHHPDVNGAHDAADKFREINEAYEVLSDPKKRKQFDRFGTTDPSQIRIKVYGPGPLGLPLWGLNEERLQKALEIVQTSLETILEDLRNARSETYSVDLNGLKVSLVVRKGEDKNLQVQVLHPDDHLGSFLGNVFSGMVNRR